ncbi:MAG: amino acid ABC transporter permease [Eubacteriales bacterium]|nr:amino acid ABC transporter permease [Eubacteriales bacterium]
MMINFKNAIYINFIKDSRYLYIVNGLKNTLIITFFALLIGIILGLCIAIVRTNHENTGRLKILNNICKVYLTIIRGTPVVVQLMILFFCIFTSREIPGIFIAIVGFGINSAAYVAEIFRAGLMSIDPGQMEAGRSLGFSYSQTMKKIIIPQAFKNVLPALLNEFIALIKETSVAGYVAVQDLTKGGDIIKSRTFDPWMPLLLVALIYLIITSILTHLVGLIEKNLRKTER